MLHEYDVISPRDQAELMKRINAAKIAAAIIDIVGIRTGSEFQKRRATDLGLNYETYKFWVQSIHTDNPPFIIGRDSEKPSTVMRLDVVEDDGREDDDRELKLTVFSED